MSETPSGYREDPQYAAILEQVNGDRTKALELLAANHDFYDWLRAIPVDSSKIEGTRVGAVQAAETFIGNESIHIIGHPARHDDKSHLQ